MGALPFIPPELPGVGLLMAGLVEAYTLIWHGHLLQPRPLTLRWQHCCSCNRLSEPA
jgi:hypothetical protein